MRQLPPRIGKEVYISYCRFSNLPTVSHNQGVVSIFLIAFSGSFLIMYHQSTDPPVEFQFDIVFVRFVLGVERNE